jgi:hypothetical protein
MIELLVTILVVLLVFGLVWYALTLIPLPPPFLQVAQVVLIIAMILVLVAYLLPMARVARLP